MTYIFDTNILLHFLRGSLIKSTITETYEPLSSKHKVVISVVTLGEIHSIAIQNKWGAGRMIALETLYKEFIIADIHAENVIQRYAEIDAYSQGRLPGKALGKSSRNMGKNDLWIAATASVLNATLISTDQDFDHLKDVFLPFLKIENSQKK